MAQDITILGETSFRNQFVKFGIKLDDRRRHCYFLGKTGMGKSTIMENMIIQDIQNGKGVCYVDPHGETVEKLLKYIPANRINDVVYFNPADYNYPFAFNIMENVAPEQRHLIASGLLGVFKKLWAESWGPRLEYLLNNAIFALLEYPGSTILGVMRILTDKDYRKKVIEQVSDPVIKSFWVNEFSKYPDKFQAEAIAPIQNKVGRFLSSSLMRNIVGQVKSSINIREAMDEKKIVLLNLSKGRIGEDNSALLGGMLITKIQLAAMSRVEIPESERNDFYLYVDEFQNFSTESFMNILSEARKYRLCLNLTHQYIQQLDEKVAASIFGNVGTLVIFRVGAEDAEFLAKEFTPRFDETDLVNIPKWNAYIKLMIDGVSSEPFSARTLANPPLPENWQENTDKVIRVSRERYATERQVVEEKIYRWSGMIAEGESVQKAAEHIQANAIDAPKAKINKPVNPNLREAVCDGCGIKTTVPFEPIPGKPIYCKDCLAKNRSLKAKAKPIAKEVGPTISLRELSKPVFTNKPAINNQPKTPPVANNGQAIQPGQVVKFE